MISKYGLIALALGVFLGVLLRTAKEQIAPLAHAVVGDVTIDQSVTGSSTLGVVTAQKLVDTASSTYFLDPAATGNSLVTAGDATVSGNIALGNTKTLRSAFGPLQLQYKSGLDAWTTGLTIQDTTGNVGIGTTGPLSKLQIGTDINVGTVWTDVMKNWRASQAQADGSYMEPSDGGSVAYSWDNGTVKVTTSAGSHTWRSGFVYLPAGKYQLVETVRPSPTADGWAAYDQYSCIGIFGISDPANTGFNTPSAAIVSVSSEFLQKDLGYAKTYQSSVFTISTADKYAIWHQTQPYFSCGYAYWIEQQYIIRLE